MRDRIPILIGRQIRPVALCVSLNTGYVSINAVLGRTVTSGPMEALIGALGLLVGGLALRAAFTALAELDAAIRDAEV